MEAVFHTNSAKCKVIYAPIFENPYYLTVYWYFCHVLISYMEIWFSHLINSNLVESFQAEFSHCFVHDFDQIEQLGMASTHLHSEKCSANYKRKEKCSSSVAGVNSQLLQRTPSTNVFYLVLSALQ